MAKEESCIQAGDTVRVFPHGSPHQYALGKVLICSANQKSIAVAFADKPPFAIIPDGGILLGPGGVQLLAMRHDVGPWIELVGGGHYEIETAVIHDGGRSIHCFRCGCTSCDRNDINLRYCGGCNRFHERTAVAVQTEGQDK